MIIQLHSTTRPTSAFNYDHPAVFFDSSNLSFQLRSSSCILRLVQPQLSATIIHLYSSTRPTSAFNYDHPAVFFDSSDLSFFNDSINLRQLPATNIKLRSSTSQPSSYQRYHSSWRPYSTITDLTHVCRSDNKLSFVIFVTPPPCSFIVFGCHLLTRIKLNSLAWSTCLSAPQHL